MTASILARWETVAGLFTVLATAPLSAQPVPALLVERAIKVAGGAAALSHTSHIGWDGDAVVHTGGRAESITGTWQLALPDSAIVATRPVGADSSAFRVVSFSGNSGLLLGPLGREPIPAAMLANEQARRWGYQLTRLVPLRDSTLSLRLVPGDSVEWKGIEVRAPGRPTARLQFDERARLRSLTLDVRDAAGQGSHQHQFVLIGDQRVVTPDGPARWFERLEITEDGTLSFVLTARNVHLVPR